MMNGYFFLEVSYSCGKFVEIRSHGVVDQEAPRTLRITAIDLKKVEWRDGEAVALLSFLGDWCNEHDG
jgi:hypothetical protein